MILLSAILHAEPPPVGEGIVLRPPVPEQHVLSDGTPVWILEDHTVPLVRVEVSLRQGYLDIDDPVAGLLASGLVGEGELRVGAGAARVWADVEVLAGQEDQALAAMREALLSPRISRRDVRTQRRRLARRRAGLVGVPGRTHNAALSQALFEEGHPLAFRPQAADYRSVSPARARAAWQELVWAGMPAILVAGDTSAASILPLLEEHLLWLGGEGTPVDIPPPDWQGREVLMVDAPGSGRSWVTLTLPAPGLGDASLPAAELATRVLGGDFTSRLSVVLREEMGVVYDIAAELTSWPGMGRIEITCSVADEDLLDTLAALDEVVGSMVTDPPGEAEVDAARRAMVLERALSMGSLVGLATDYGVAQVYGMPPAAELQRFAAYDALTAEDVAAAAESLLGDALWVITGDGVVIEPLLEASAWAPDRVRSGWLY